MKGLITYFDEPGETNTEETLRLARSRAEQLGTRQITVASTHGRTAMRAREIFHGLNVGIIAVSICASFEERGWTLGEDERDALNKSGITVLTSIHALGDDVSEGFGVTAPNVVVRETLYTFSQGMKVAVEIALMAADAGLLDMSQEVISIAGSGSGADTAVVLLPAYSRTFRQLRVREILAKPR